MRFLKNKIAKAQGFENNESLQEHLEKQSETPEPVAPVQAEPPQTPRDSRTEISFPPINPLSPKKAINSDNIIKNYGRAMTNFAISTMARTFLRPILEKLQIELPAFQKYIEERKKSANCIKKLRQMLPFDDEIGTAEYPFKKAFQEICIKFLKFFCVNWLYNSKIAEKITHLKYRFKILRRIKNPQFFTYLKDFNG